MTWFISFLICYLYLASSITGKESEPSYDTVFLVDSSNNVREPKKYDLIRRFVVNLTLELAEKSKQRVGIVSFSGVVYRMVLPLTKDVAKIHEGIKEMNDTGGYSFVSSALNFTFEKMFKHHVRPGDGKQIVTVLGGRPHNYDAINKMANSLKAKGMEMYTVGIGKDFFKQTKELRVLASLPVKDHTLRTTYKSLLKSAPIMLEKLKKDGYGFISKRRKLHKSKGKTFIPSLSRSVHRKKISRKRGVSARNRIKYVAEYSYKAKSSATAELRRGNIVPAANTLNTAAGVAAKKPAAASATTVATPPTATPGLSNLITVNSSTPTGSAACVGHVPASNRIVTNGTMVTGIIANTTVMPTNNRACDPSKTMEENINMGDSGIDSTWDYGK